MAMENELRVPGGILILVKPHIDIKIIKKVREQANDYYGLALTCMIVDTIIVAVYFSPKCPLSYTKRCINKALDGFEAFPRKLIGGDFNQKNDVQFLIDNGFKNFVNLPTTKWLTRIDHLYANFDTEIFTCVNPSYFSDHHSIITVLGMNGDAGFSCKVPSELDECMDFTEDIEYCPMEKNNSHQVAESLLRNPEPEKNVSKLNSQTLDIFHRLKNLWNMNTCWLNCIFQALWAILASDKNFSLTTNSDVPSCIFNWIYGRSNEISRTFDLCTEKISDLPLKKAFLMSIGKFNEVHMKSQEDVLETFQEFVNQCDSLSCLKHCQLETYKCPACDSQKTQNLTETVLLVPITEKFMIRGKFDLGNAIHSKFTKDEISEKVCDNSACKFQCVKTLTMTGKPRYLIVNVNRAGPSNKKDTTACIVSHKLMINTTEIPVEFELIAVIKHIGNTADAGHYVCFRKQDEDWFLINDTAISKCDCSDLVTANLFIYKNSNDTR